MKYLWYALLALTFTVATGARAADDKVGESPYYPLKIGTSWTYAASDKKFSVKVAKHEEFGNEFCARVEGAGSVEHIVIKPDGIYRAGFGGSKVDPPLKFLQLPPVKGDTWKVESAVGADKISGSFKVDILEEVKVPAGTFKDVVTSSGDFEVGGTKISFTYFFAKDVGIIKQIIKVGGVEAAGELEKFEPAK